VPEHLRTVDGDDRDVVPVSPEQVLVAFNVNLSERIVIGATAGQDDLFGLVAKMTTRTAIDYYVRFDSHLDRITRYKFRLEAGTARRYTLNETQVSARLEPAGGARL
jgi:hypothetical protein